MKKNSSLMLLALVFLLSACRTENLTLENESHSDHQDIVSFKTINVTKDNPIAQKATLFDYRSKNGNDNLHIDYNHVEFLQLGGRKTYTFKVLNDDANAAFQNIVVTEYADGNMKTKIVTYNLNDYEKAELLKGNSLDFTGKVHSIETDNHTVSGKIVSNGKCYKETIVYQQCGSGQHNSGNIQQWGNCTHPIKPQTFIKIEETDCTTGGGGPSGPGGPGPIGNPENPSEPGTIDPLTPTIPIPNNFAFIRFLGTLTDDLQQVINSESNLDFYTGLNNYYYSNMVTQDTKNFIKWAIQFKFDNPNVSFEQFQPMLTFAHDFLQENPNTINPEQIFQRLKDLDNALTQNPNFLINIPCSQLPDWQELANHPIPQSVINKVFQVNGNTSWFSSAVIQNLDYSKSFTVNMDVYPVKITNMPEKSPGVKYTHAEFFDYFRKNINNFTDINHGNFYPVVEPQYGIDDTQLWYSNNPIGSLITIKIPADNGTVVCSGFNSQAWIFTTVKSPWDGEHPVSGNRLFGYFVDAAGNMVIYTRGVDRFTTKVSNNALQYTVENFGYSEAKTMWQNMQQKVSTFVNNKNGNSSIIPGVDYTPSYIFIKDYLKGNKPLTALGCH